MATQLHVCRYEGGFSGDATILAVVVLTTEMGRLRAKRAI